MRVRPLSADDPPALEAAFARIGWTKPRSLFQRYLSEAATGVRWVRLVEADGRRAGYVTVVWDSDDSVLAAAGIPEIVDLNVLPDLRRRGVGTRLMDAAEQAVRERATRAGLRVGLHPGYGAAQRFYVLRGYVPDGRGALRGGRPVEEHAEVPLDDDTTLRLVKELDGGPGRAPGG